MNRGDRTALQRISAATWERERTARVDALATALHRINQAADALPHGGHVGLQDVLAQARASLRLDLKVELAKTNPFTPHQGDT